MLILEIMGKKVIQFLIKTILSEGSAILDYVIFLILATWHQIALLKQVTRFNTNIIYAQIAMTLWEIKKEINRYNKKKLTRF